MHYVIYMRVMIVPSLKTIFSRRYSPMAVGILIIYIKLKEMNGHKSLCVLQVQVQSVFPSVMCSYPLSTSQVGCVLKTSCCHIPHLFWLPSKILHPQSLISLQQGFLTFFVPWMPSTTDKIHGSLLKILFSNAWRKKKQ